MHEIVLESAALLLTLFCLLYSVTARRELYALPKGGLRHALEERRFSFLLLLCSLLLSAVLALGSAWAQAYGAPGWAVLTLYTLLSLFRLLLPCLLALYIRNYTADLRGGRTLPLPLFALPLVLGAALLILNLLRSCC